MGKSRRWKWQHKDGGEDGRRKRIRIVMAVDGERIKYLIKVMRVGMESNMRLNADQMEMHT